MTKVYRKLSSAMPYLFISPFFILFTIFSVYPIFATLYYSLTDWRGLGHYEFVGAKNYIKLFNTPLWYKSLTNTAFFVGTIAISITVLSLILAIILNTRFVKFKNFFRLSSVLPALMSTAVIALVFRVLFAKELGLINVVFLKLGLYTFNIGWFDDPRLAPWMIVIMVLWTWTGYNSIIVLAGLNAIPTELYEVATVDGAGILQRFRYITIPLLYPILLFILVTNTISVLNMFTEVQVLSPRTPGAPGDSLYTGMLYVYMQSFGYLNFGYAAAASYVITVISLVIAAIELKYFAKMVR